MRSRMICVERRKKADVFFEFRARFEGAQYAKQRKEIHQMKFPTLISTTECYFDEMKQQNKYLRCQTKDIVNAIRLLNIRLRVYLFSICWFFRREQPKQDNDRPCSP